MKKFKINVVFLVIMLVLSGCSDKSESNNKSLFSIGVIQFASHPALDEAYEGFIEGLKELNWTLGEDYTLDHYNAQGDSATAETIADKLVFDKHDLIYAIATPAAQAIAQKTQTIPILVAAITDPKSAGLVISNENPETNVSGVSDLTPVKRQVGLLKDLSPDINKVAVMYANSEDNSRFQADIAKKELESLGFEYIDASVSEANQVQSMGESLINKVDAIYVPTDNLISESFSIVSQIAEEHKIITVVGEIAMVNSGGLITDGISYFNSGKKVSELALQILVDGHDISSMPIIYLTDDDLELAININTEKALGITIPDELKEKAIIVE